MQTNLPSHAWSESGTPQWTAEESKEAFRWVFLSDMDNSKFLEIFSLKRQLQTSTTPLNVLQMSNKCPMENPINVLKKIQVIWSKF